jgi:hypothetical protein
MTTGTKRLFGTVMLALLCSAHPEATGLAKSLQDMDDESRAAVVRELVKSKSYTYGVTPKNKSNQISEDDNEDEDDADGGKNKKGCHMEVANAKSEPGRPTPRRMVVVVTGPVVQICNK